MALVLQLHMLQGQRRLYKSEHPGASPSEVRNALINSGSTPSTVCDGKGHGYFTGDPDSIREPLLYVGNPTNTVTDATPPTVTATTPVAGASNVATSSQITATFSEAVQASTVSTSTFIVKNSAGSSIPGTVSLTGTDNPKATFTPSSSLAFSTSYTATISNVKDLAGNTMSPSKSWSFNTGADPSAPPSTPPPSSSCSNNLHINKATSSGSKGSSGPSKAIDNKFSTKWISTSISKPWIRADLGTSKTICSVGIAWADGTSRQYSFVISGSTDGSVYTNVYSGKSKGTTKATETYSFADSSARYVKVTITKGVSGSSKISAQISELDIFGKAGSSSISGQSDVFSSSSDSGTIIEGQTPSESIKNSGPDNNSVN